MVRRIFHTLVLLDNPIGGREKLPMKGQEGI